MSRYEVFRISKLIREQPEGTYLIFGNSPLILSRVSDTRGIPGWQLCDSAHRGRGKIFNDMFMVDEILRRKDRPWSLS